MNKNVTKALLAMLAISILPGCGKKNDAVANNVGVASPAAISSIGSGGCATVTNNGSAQTLTFNGSLNLGYGEVNAQLQAYGYGAYTGGFGSSIHRTNYSGDTIDLYMSGNSGYAVVTLSALTIQSIVQGQMGGNYYGYAGGYNNATATVCGVEFFHTGIVTGTSGNTLSGIIRMWTNGKYITYYNGQVILL